ncbi:MAG: hypothetical protein JWN29_1778 [Acidimicrobiales bacterium]|nr:hypothetical protein [Acidimicrobiales bacterium]
MTTVAAKFWFAVSALALVAGVAYNAASSGEWYGSFVLGSIVVAAFLLGLLATVIRDGDIEGAAASAEVPVRRSLPAGWPALAAVGGGVAIVGLAGRNALLYVGLGILGFVFVEWMVQSWAERATGDPAYNHSLRHRIMSPIEVPLLAMLVIAVFLISLSRVLLALPKDGSTIVAIVLAVAILGVASLFAAKPRLGSSVLAGALALGAVALIAAGIAGGVAGERHIEKHHAEGSAGTEAGGTTTTTSTPASTP